jgi:hypothetical protein
MKYKILSLLIFIIAVIKSFSIAEELSNDFRVVIAPNGLVLRDSGSTSAKKIELLSLNSVVEVVEENSEEIIINRVKGKWCKVNYNTLIGWVFGGYLSKIPSDKDNITGTYELDHIFEKPKLILKKDMSFNMTSNVCEGMVEIKGKYKIKENTLYLLFKPKQYINFMGENDSEYHLKIISTCKLEFQDNANCAPEKGQIFFKIRVGE